ncbi:chemotaxis protein CheW [Methylobacterium oryzihabitans]|uniref:Chemotaxis protein CheW n=1 Tax=Methylobacterium oryzihabitans TaxID=2499852 RepID=A0A437PH03_9HYPH|nr:chemotaxis protein CheW [Methylobacterium oryzihabitans]RVU21549.1 chemotaxis protein CheW [Methylobacterium oryzihabitans]
MDAGTAYLLVDVAGTPCALRREAADEILPLPRLWRPPGAPAALAGFLNLSGEAVAVLDLAALLGLAAPAGRGLYRHLVLCTAPRIALLVERVTDLVTVPPDAVRPVSGAATLNGCVAEEIRLGDRLVHGLAVERILLAEERGRLSDATREAQRRLAEWAA